MTDRRAQLRPILVVLAVVAALAFTVQGVKRMSFYRSQIAARQAEFKDLTDLRLALGDQRAAFDWLSSTARGNDALVAVIERTMPGQRNDLVLRETKSAGEGWTIRQYDLRIPGIAGDRLGDFFAACANARPPIRLVEIQVSAGSEAGGLVDAQLTLAEMSAADLGSAK